MAPEPILDLYDTMVVVDCVKQNLNQRFFVCEATIFEMLKNKPEAKQRKQLRNLISYCKRTGSELLLSDIAGGAVLLGEDENAAYSEAVRICEKTSKKMAEVILSLFTAILMLVQLLNAHGFQKPERLHNVERIIAGTRLIIDKFGDSIITGIQETLLSETSEKCEEELLNLYRGLVENINRHSSDEGYQLKSPETLSINAMLSGVDSKTRKSFSEQFVDEVVKIVSGSKSVKEFWKAYLIYLFTKKHRFNVNDAIDMQICFAAYTNDLCLVTEDDHCRRAYCDLVRIERP